MKTASDFQKAAQLHGINYWPVHNCSMCEYPCSYVFDDDQVHYDSGCDCVNRGSVFIKSSWHEVADFYNAQKHPAVIAKMNGFWRFDE